MRGGFRRARCRLSRCAARALNPSAARPLKAMTKSAVPRSGSHVDGLTEMSCASAGSRGSYDTRTVDPSAGS